MRIAYDPAFRSAKRNVNNGAFPGHPGSQRFHFIKGDCRMVANTAFARPASAVVLHAESVENVERAVIHLDGQRKRKRTPRAPQHFAQAGFEAALFGGGVELAHSNAE